MEAGRGFYGEGKLSARAQATPAHVQGDLATQHGHLVPKHFRLNYEELQMLV